MVKSRILLSLACLAAALAFVGLTPGPLRAATMEWAPHLPERLDRLRPCVLS